jgi:hypothetical protein
LLAGLGERQNVVTLIDIRAGQTMTTPLGWIVRVWVGEDEAGDPPHGTTLYIAGFPTQNEAEAAVRKFRQKNGEQMEVLEPAVTPGIGPQCEPGEVRWLGGV